MKLIHKIALSALSLTISFSACQKGKDIQEPGFGSLSMISTFSSDAKPILIKVDGETKDTISFDHPTTKDRILLVSGKHRVTLVSSETNKVLQDTTVVVETRKSNVFPSFWYRGVDLLFDDYNPATMQKPAQGNILIRFISTGIDLPEDIKIELIAFYRSGRSTVRVSTGKIIEHLTKEKFTEYLELPNPSTFVPAGIQAYYTIEGYDNRTGDRIMGLGIGSTPGNQLMYSDIENNFQPNLVISTSIVSDVTNTPIFIKAL